MNPAIRALKITLVLYVPLAFTLLPPPSAFHLVIGFTGAVLALFFLDGAVKARGLARWWNALMVAGAVIPSAYFLASVERLSMPLGQPPALDHVMGVVLVLVVVEASRQALDWVMPSLAVLLLLYDVFGSVMPGILYHPGLSFTRVISQLTGSLSGPYGEIPTIIIEVVAMFLVFGAVVQGAGIADFFGSLTKWISGRVRSGAGLTAVSMSSLFGSITGAPVANVGTTGSFTIPLMKRAGYTPEQAAAIEGVASTGSQIIPPILGTAAFLMAQFLHKPYSQIAAASLFPSLLFILCVFLAVHGLGMQSNTRVVVFGEEERHRWSKSYLMLPVAALIVALMQGFSPQYAAFVATVATFAMYVAELALRRQWRGGWAALRKAMSPMARHIESAADGMIIVVIAGAIIGILVTLLTLPLTIQRLSSAAIAMADGNLLVILGIVAVASILLGSGLPTVATYVLVVLLFAPTLVQLGVEPLAAHMFVFYLGVAADISPPVAMAVLAAAGIARADFWQATWIAMKIGISIFILPFLFVLQPAILRLPTSFGDALVFVAVTAGMVASAAGLCGYFFGNLKPPLRAAFLAIAVAALYPARGIWLPIIAIAAFCVCTAVAMRSSGQPVEPTPV